MAKKNPMGRGSAVALNLPVDQVRFLRGLFTSARAGAQQELKEYPKQLKEPALQRREVAAYGRLLAALDELVIVPDDDLRAILGDLTQVIDSGNEYNRVVSEHEALHGLLGQLNGGKDR